MMGYYFGDYGNMMGFGGGIIMLLFWVAVIIFIVWIVREISGRNTNATPNSGSKAIDILKERYAKGEINKEEFEQKKKDLG